MKNTKSVKNVTIGQEVLAQHGLMLESNEDKVCRRLEAKVRRQENYKTSQSKWAALETACKQQAEICVSRNRGSDKRVAALVLNKETPKLTKWERKKMRGENSLSKEKATLNYTVLDKEFDRSLEKLERKLAHPDPMKAISPEEYRRQLNDLCLRMNHRKYAVGMGRREAEKTEARNFWKEKWGAIKKLEKATLESCREEDAMSRKLGQVKISRKAAIVIPLPEGVSHAFTSKEVAKKNWNMF